MEQFSLGREARDNYLRKGRGRQGSLPPPSHRDYKLARVHLLRAGNILGLC